MAIHFMLVSFGFITISLQISSQTRSERNIQGAEDWRIQKYGSVMARDMHTKCCRIALGGENNSQT